MIMADIVISFTHWTQDICRRWSVPFSYSQWSWHQVSSACGLNYSVVWGSDPPLPPHPGTVVALVGVKFWNHQQCTSWAPLSAHPLKKRCTSLCSTTTFEDCCGTTVLDMLGSREMTEQTEWQAKQLPQAACTSDLKCWGAWDTSCGYKAQDTTPPITWRREV